MKLRFLLSFLLSMSLIFFDNQLFGNLYRDGIKWFAEGKTVKAKRAFYHYFIQNPQTVKAAYAKYYYAQLVSETKLVIDLLKSIRDQYPLFPKLDNVLDELGIIYFSLNRYAECYKIYTELYNRFSKSKLRGKACYYIGQILLIKGQYKQCRLFINSVNKQFIHDRYYTYLFYVLGDSYYYENQFHIALPYYQKIYKQYRKSEITSAALLKIGICYLKLQQTSITKSYFEILIKHYPHSIESEIARRYLLKADSTHSVFKNKSSPTNRNIDENKYFLQFGIYAVKKNALIIKTKLSQLGLNNCDITIITYSNGKVFYKPLSGPYTSSSSAIKIKEYLLQHGIKSIIHKKKE